MQGRNIKGKIVIRLFLIQSSEDRTIHYITFQTSCEWATQVSDPSSQLNIILLPYGICLKEKKKKERKKDHLEKKKERKKEIKNKKERKKETRGWKKEKKNQR